MANISRNVYACGVTGTFVIYRKYLNRNSAIMCSRVSCISTILVSNRREEVIEVKYQHRYESTSGQR